MTLHPNVHPAWSQWSDSQTLHVISVYYNPFRFRTRRELFHDFAGHMAQSANVRFWPVEIAFGARPWEVTEAGNPQHIQLRTNQVLWFKENAVNLAVNRIPIAAPYLAYFDADVTNSRADWALEAIHQLQHYHWVQLFSNFTFQTRDHLPVHQHAGYAYVYNQYAPAVPKVSGGNFSTVLPRPASDSNYGSADPAAVKAVAARVRNVSWPGAPGLGWAFTRTGFDLVGGFMDRCIMGSADWHMALGLTGDEARGASVVDSKGSGDAYNNYIGAWQRRAFAAIQGKIGYVANALNHHWHGDQPNRQYSTRWEMLDRNHFDPLVDVVHDSQGLLRYVGNKPKLEREMVNYFLDRDDDSTQLSRPTML